jgi:spore coat protein H
MKSIFFLAFSTVLVGFFSSLTQAGESQINSDGSVLTPGSIFRGTNVWTIHLSFMAEQWDAMEPKRESRARGRGSFLQGPEGGRNGIASAFGWTFDYVHADLEFGTNRFKDVGVRVKGNGTFLTSRRTLKRSLKVDLNQFVKGQKFAGMSQLNLHNSVRDPSSMNETIAYGLFRQGGVPAPRTAYARVFITVAGKYDRKYFGLYTLVEDVGNNFIEERFGTSKGAILKPVTPSLFSDLGDDWKRYNQTYDPKGTLSDEEKQRVIEFCKFTSRATDAEFAAKLPEYIDLDNFARYMAITVWLSDLDGILGPGQNYYVYLHPKTQKFNFIPWDQDQTFGQFPLRTSQDQRENLSIHKPWSGGNGFLEKVFKTELFKKAYLARLEEFNKSIFQTGPIHRQVDELANILRSPIQEEPRERIAEFNKAVAGEKVTIYMDEVGSRGTVVKPIKPFVEARRNSVSEQIAGKSQGHTTGSFFGPFR